MGSVIDAKQKGELNISQRQAIIKLIEIKLEIKATLKIGNPFFY